MKLKDKKIEILESKTVVDKIGNHTTELVTVATVWAYFRQLSGDETFPQGTPLRGVPHARVNVEESVMFRIGYRDDITTAHVIRYKGTFYNITRVDVYEGYKNDLTLYCKRRA